MAKNNLQILLNGKLTTSASKKLKGIFDKLNANDLSRELSIVSIKIKPESWGFSIYPLLRDRLNTDNTLFESLINSFSQSHNITYQIITLQVLGKIVRLNWDRLSNSYIDFLHSAVNNIDLNSKVRNRAIRQLAKYTDTKTINVILKLLKSNDPTIINAAAAVISIWIRHNKYKLPNEAKQNIYMFCLNRQKDAINCNSLLKYLAIENYFDSNGRGGQILDGIVKSIKQTKDRDNLICSVGRWLNSKSLGFIIQDVIKRPTDNALIALNGMMSQSPIGISGLYGEGYWREYLFILKLTPHFVTPRDFTLFKKMLKSKDVKVATFAKSAYFQSIRIMPSNRFAWIKYSQANNNSQTQNPVNIGGGSSTSMQPGDAIYKSLGASSSSGSGTNILGNHWHAGIFCQFGSSFIPNVFCLQGVHVSALFNTVNSFSSSQSFESRTISISNTLSILYKDFVKKFGCNSNQPFKGARSSPNANYFVRKQIIGTANGMVGKDISYTFEDQLDYCNWDWDGTIDDIDELRCDGFVEYCYEKNGIKVCEGEDSSEWNISKRGMNNAENHNDFHGNGCTPSDYSRGELCPRIQAGDVGSDTSFIIRQPSIPQISGFSVDGLCNGVYIFFNTIAELSESIFVRLMVRKKGDIESWFIFSEDPVGLGEEAGGFPQDTWCLKKMNIHKWQSGIGIFWFGKTVDKPCTQTTILGIPIGNPIAMGPDFKGQSGSYEFILQCVDEGGNVSDKWKFEKDILWQ